MSKPSVDELIPVLASLIGFDTTSSESNLPLITWIEDYLRKYGVPCWRVNEGAGKASLLARIGADGAGGIVLSGHTDCVPTKDQQWKYHPYFLTEKDGLFYGRGTCDMKSFLALALTYVPYWVQHPPKQPIWFAFSHDEEVGCLGAAPMAQALHQYRAMPSLVVVGEPTNMELVVAHKGIYSFETIVTGREAHSSMPHQGVNAAMILAELVHTLSKLAQFCEISGRQNPQFTPSYSTVHVGVMEGGVARNIIPKHARMLWEVRPIPGDDIDALLQPFYLRCAELEEKMRAVDASTSIVTRQRSSVHGLEPVADAAPHMALALRLAETNHTGFVSYGTEGGILQKHGFPVVVCGPGSIDQAHQPDEFVSRMQLAKGLDFMGRL